METITTFHHQGTGSIHVVVSSCSADDMSHGANKCTTFQLSPDVLSCELIYCFIPSYFLRLDIFIFEVSHAAHAAMNLVPATTIAWPERLASLKGCIYHFVKFAFTTILQSEILFAAVFC